MIRLNCKICNSINSEIPPEKRTVTTLQYKTETEEFEAIKFYLDKGINNFPNCEHCNNRLTPIFRNNQ